jgi:hypothetical protein
MIIPDGFVAWVKPIHKKSAIHFFILYHEAIRFNVSVFCCGVVKISLT